MRSSSVFVHIGLVFGAKAEIKLRQQPQSTAESATLWWIIKFIRWSVLLSTVSCKSILCSRNKCFFRLVVAHLLGLCTRHYQDWYTVGIWSLFSSEIIGRTLCTYLVWAWWKKKTETFPIKRWKEKRRAITVDSYELRLESDPNRFGTM